ncbi:MAG: methyltransferase domain-containing protein [Magnetococcales bacterium]|nr:methyltransferase domain-containing protein [Magnetococcales bacterium]
MTSPETDVTPSPEPLSFHPPQAAVALDPRRLRRAWQRAEPETTGAFNKLAEIDAMLVDRLEMIKIDPQRMLDLGCRTGRVSSLLRARWPQAKLVTAGLESSWLARYAGTGSDLCITVESPTLPFANRSFDLVLSGMALHWLGDLNTSLREIRRILRPDGLFLAAIPGESTLQELRICLEELDRRRYGKAWPRVPMLPEIQKLGDQMVKAGLALTVVDRISVEPRFSSVAELLRTLKQIGGGNHHQQRPPGLTGKGFALELAQIYKERFGDKGGLPATLEILFCHGWKEPAGRG